MTVDQQLTTDRTLSLTYSAPGDAWSVEVATDTIEAVLVKYAGKKRGFLVRLINGWSRAASAPGAGVSARATQLWCKADSEFAEAAKFCEEIGFGTVVEVELYRRAMAGTKDSGSMLALELVLKSRDPIYRAR